MKNTIQKFILSIGICQLAGIIGALFNSSSIKTWYVTLQKPTFNPPNWVFAPVWLTLYLLMGISLFLVLVSKASPQLKQTAIIFFAIQLVLNTFWSFFFFFLKNPFLGLIEIIVLIVFIILTVIWFHRVRPVASILLWPYLLWCLFAAFLNYSLWQLNK